MTKERPLVSIVVPVYNAEKFLADTIGSVQTQTYDNWELLLVDDCSSDKSVGIIEKYQKDDKRIKLISMKHNSGAALSRNAGIDKATGQYLAFLDADDLWAKNKLETQIAFMQKNDYAFTYTDYEFADESGISTGKRVVVPSSITYRKALKNHIIWTSTVIVDLMKVSKDIASMPDVRRGQDAATWWKILRHVGSAYGINEVLSFYRRTTASLSANKLKAMKRTWYLFTKVEKLGLVKSAYNFMWYGYNAVKKRV